MNNGRMEELLINALEWVIEIGDDATHDLIHNMNISSDELEEIGYEKENFPKMHEWANE